MGKRVYNKPMLITEAFVPQEYVAACTNESGVIYKFACDASKGSLYLEDNGVDGFQANAFCNCGQGHDSEYKDWPFWEKQCSNWIDGDSWLGNFSPCPAAHEASSTDVFVDGYIVNGSSVQDVIVWRGANGGEGHATAQLDKNEWSKALS